LIEAVPITSPAALNMCTSAISPKNAGSKSIDKAPIAIA
jgi:hypothetical protein